MKKKLFLDTNVFIDYLGSRKDYAAASNDYFVGTKGVFLPVGFVAFFCNSELHFECASQKVK